MSSQQRKNVRKKKMETKEKDDAWRRARCEYRKVITGFIKNAEIQASYERRADLETTLPSAKMENGSGSSRLTWQR